MTTIPDRRTRKRLATRQTISDAATHLFFARGFDGVTVDEIADAADVGRMTVFSHFKRKEDMFFDRDQDLRHLILDAVAQRLPEVPPVEAVRLRAHHFIAEASPEHWFSGRSLRFVETVMQSETLMARARAIRDEATRDLTRALVETTGQPTDDPDAVLVAALLAATISVAFLKAHDILRRDGDQHAARALFLAMIDRGVHGVNAAAEGSCYTKTM